MGLPLALLSSEKSNLQPLLSVKKAQDGLELFSHK